MMGLLEGREDFKGEGKRRVLYCCLKLGGAQIYESALIVGASRRNSGGDKSEIISARPLCQLGS
jgi:hypothetical protein